MTPGRKPRVTDEELMETLEELTASNTNPVVTTEEVSQNLPLAHDSVYDRLNRFYDEGKVHKKSVGARGLIWWPVSNEEPGREWDDPEDWSIDEPPETESDDLEYIRVSNLDIDLRGSRPYITDFPTSEKDEQLMESIEEIGLLSPLLVRPLDCVEYGFDTEAEYVVVAGSRRLRAVDELGWDYVLCTVADLTDEEAIRASLHENLGREDAQEDADGN